jgi:serine/threonine protein kinase
VQNIVKLLGVCTRNEPVYTVMEYMLYGDLKTYLLARRHLVNERNREELDEVSNRLEPVLNKLKQSDPSRAHRLQPRSDSA